MANGVLLYVEDEDAAVFLLEAALREIKTPVRLYRVSDGEQALSFLRRMGSYEKAPTPDVVLLDLNLPRKNGFEVLADVRHCDGLNAIPIVVFTSSSRLIDKEQSLALGARHYITKPASFDGFVQAVRAVCSYLPG